MDEEVNAYLFNLLTKGAASGYLIINSYDGQLVEYSYEGTCFLYEAINTTNQKLNNKSKYKYPKNKGKVYWLGDINYIVGYETKDCVSKRFYDVTSSIYQEIDKEEAEKLEENLPKSKRPDSGDSYITDPTKYESGYDDSDIYTIPKVDDVSFFRMNDLVNFGCTPVAGTNLLKYYYTVDKVKYKKLLDVSWKQTYYDLRYLMKTKEDGGTPDLDTVEGYTKYISSKGYNVSVKLVKGTNNGLKVADELKNRKNPYI